MQIMMQAVDFVLRAAILLGPIVVAVTLSRKRHLSTGRWLILSFLAFCVAAVCMVFTIGGIFRADGNPDVIQVASRYLVLPLLSTSFGAVLAAALHPRSSPG